MLEKMAEFFEARLDGYDDHMISCIESAQIFYPYTAGQLPQGKNSRILDLGCGTGLELEHYARRCPTAGITGIDLSGEMLAALERKHLDFQEITLIQGSYFDVPFGEAVFDGAVSVESLHHFTKAEKVPLYARLRSALKAEGYFVLTDYFALSEEEERQHRQNLLALKAEQGITDSDFYHYDTPLTVEHEIQALLEAGFSSVEVLQSWGPTSCIKAVR